MSLKVLAVATFTSVFVNAAAHAVTITVTDATGATSSPFVLANFGTSSSNGLVSTAPIMLSNAVITFTPNVSNPQAGMYSGSVVNTSSSPFSGTGLTASNYLVAEPNDPVSFTYTSPQTSFSLLWGSVESYNSLDLTFTSGGTTTSTTITGAQIVAVISPFFKTADPAFVTISGLTFTSLSATSTTAAFEFVPAGQVLATSVPEPASLALFSVSLAGMAAVRRRKRV